MSRRGGGRTSKTRRVTLQKLRELTLALPDVEEGTSYGTLAFRVRKKFLARLREDGASLVIRVDLDEREVLMEADPETFYITDHYLNHPYVLVRLSTVDPEDLQELLEEAWRYAAPKRLVAAYDGAS